ncbi:MAG: hypothetical protein RLY93_05320 [Sumerlaeia bacterium]
MSPQRPEPEHFEREERQLAASGAVNHSASHSTQRPLPPKPNRKEFNSNWAKILWGNPEEGSNPAAARAPMPPKTLPPTPPKPPQRPKAPDKRSDSTPSPSFQPMRASHRHACSFPGLLRILIPEECFEPKVLAVRVLDIGLQGAQVETKQLKAGLAEAIGRQPRYFQLEALIPGKEKAKINGLLAWQRMEDGVAHFGLYFNEPHPELATAFLPGEEDRVLKPSTKIRAPELDSFPSITSNDSLTLCGRCRDGERVLLQMGEESFEAPVENEGFQINLPLHRNAENHFLVMAVREDECSIPTPICIIHRPGVHDTISIKECDLVEDLMIDQDGHRLRVTVHGRAGEMFSVLRAFEDTLEFAESCHILFEITGDARRSAERLKQRLDRVGVIQKAVGDLFDPF